MTVGVRGRRGAGVFDRVTGRESRRHVRWHAQGSEDAYCGAGRGRDSDRRRALAGPLPAMLAEAGLVPPDRLARLRRAQMSSDAEDPQAATHSNTLVAAMLTDVPCRAVSAVTARLWQRQRERLFAFARPLAAVLTRPACPIRGSA